MNKNKLYWICQVLGWSIFGVVQLILFAVAGNVTSLFIFSQLIQVIFYILLTHMFRGIILHLGWLKSKWYSLLPRFLAGSLLLAIVHYLFIILSSWVTGDFDANQDFNLLSIVASLFVSMALFLIWSLLYMSFHYFDRYNKSLQFEAAAKEAELNALKAQLNPHFIFNALNSIRALVDENPTKSKNSITRLSNIFRNSLSTQKKELVPFEEELNLVRDYLELEGIRYEERLKTSYSIDSGSFNFKIPPLMIQTLVENGIKHGISTLKTGGQINITTKVEEKGLKIQIRNSGTYLKGTSGGVGYGLLNTTKRLDIIYGEKASFSIENLDEMVQTNIFIPDSLDL